MELKYNKCKQDYINLKNKFKRNIIKIADKEFSGAGVLLIEKNDDDYYIILFENAKKPNYFEDLGGGIDDNDIKNNNILEHTALREALEESCGLLNFLDINSAIETIKNNYIDVDHKGIYYRCFLLCLDANIVNEKDFQTNLKLIKKDPKMLSFMKEMNNVTRFSFNQLKTDIKNITNGTFKTVDINGNKCNINRRITNILKNLDVHQLKVAKDYSFNNIKLHSNYLYC